MAQHLKRYEVKLDGKKIAPAVGQSRQEVVRKLKAAGYDAKRFEVGAGKVVRRG